MDRQAGNFVHLTLTVEGWACQNPPELYMWCTMYILHL